jgi:hypothetical protein
MGLTNYSVNPSTWKSLKLFLSNKTGFDDVMKSFLQQLSDFGTQTQTLLSQLQAAVLTLQTNMTAVFIAALLNAAGLLTNGAHVAASIFASSLFVKTINLGTVTTNQTVDCVNANGVVVAMTTATTGISLALTHLSPGVHVTVVLSNSSGGAITVGMTATNPSNVALPVFWKSTNLINMTTTGVTWAGGTSLIATGSSISGNDLYMVFN